MMNNERVLIISHGHPDHHKGGAELAAYRMYQSMRDQGVDAYFLARSGLTPHGGAAFSTRGGNPREILFHASVPDEFTHSNILNRHIWNDFRGLLEAIKPTIVHVHHYFLLGIELLTEIKNTMPDARLVMTFHEFMAMCPRNGLMLKTNGSLCYKAEYRDCASCLPKHQPADFFMRERYLKRHLSAVDAFVSPSEFLKQRYVEWGIEADKITVIENGQVEALASISTSRGDHESGVNVAYFGQVNPFKGIDVLLDAYAMLDESYQQVVRINIHGANLESQSDEFKESIEDKLGEHQRFVKFHGSYEPQEMASLLEEADWVVVPSTWWENSPMVIQEAKTAGVPLIVSNIGGMAEKVAHEQDGLHFQVNNPASLAKQLMRLVDERALRTSLAANIKKPISVDECVIAHLPVYSLSDNS